MYGGHVDETFTFLGFELLGRWLSIQFPSYLPFDLISVKGEIICNQFWIFGFGSSIWATFRIQDLKILRNSLT